MINWKVRFKQPVFVVSFITLILTFIYNLLGMLGIVPAVSQEMVMNVVVAVVQILTALGILVDPTTKGISDSERARQYDIPA